MVSLSNSFHIEVIVFFFFLMIRRPPRSPLFPYPPLFRSTEDRRGGGRPADARRARGLRPAVVLRPGRRGQAGPARAGGPGSRRGLTTAGRIRPARASTR